MTGEEVIRLYNELTRLGIKIWIDGGWGIDVLLGKQTRPHEDIDIVVQQKDIPKLRDLLDKQGFKDVSRPDTSPWNFVLGDTNGRLVDVHAVVFDEKGNGMYGPLKKGVMYPAQSLTGTGVIQGKPVKSVSAEYVVKFHSRYTPDENDFKDVSALCEKFGIELPEEYQRFKK